MKKAKIITSVAASAVLAALPAVGVFADGATNTITETVQVTLDSSCKFNADGTSGGTDVPATVTYGPTTMTNGAKYSSDDTSGGGSAWTGTYGVYCNNATGWSVTAVGAGSGTDKTQMTPAVSGHAPISTGTNASGTTADWAFKVNKASSDSTVNIADGFSTFHNIPSTATTVVSTEAATTASGKGSFKTGYQVYIGTDTVADTYTGAVTYVLGANS